ncbi:GNAT family N-acetyltransferase [Muricauda sp. TY007]|uniref:GNAT family N-acetyltransferase n=1 Tax=Allomuricauda sp. TY007 TaxID=2683200 RepID=UPI0013C26BE0|nr:GNAT family protein [Muricauda sp. TY007]NDV15441.1 GNAT family N-acetyltransferase [Muricauda sp. TY007]
MKLSVREMKQSDIEHFAQYWLNATDQYLLDMGVDTKKRPTKEQIEKLVNDQIGVPMEKRKAYFLTWLYDDEPIGCSNVNQIEYGKKAFMHLHIWRHSNRQRGIGTRLIKKSLPFYFKNLKLQELYCEPYALNPAPNKAMGKIGFTFIKQYLTVPGASNFEQMVNQWKLTKMEYESIMTKKKSR